MFERSIFDKMFDFVHIDLDLYDPVKGALEYLIDNKKSPLSDAILAIFFICFHRNEMFGGLLPGRVPVCRVQSSQSCVGALPLASLRSGGTHSGQRSAAVGCRRPRC